MRDVTEAARQIPRLDPWNKGKLTGANPPLRSKHVWSIRSKLQLERRVPAPTLRERRYRKRVDTGSAADATTRPECHHQIS